MKKKGQLKRPVRVFGLPDSFWVVKNPQENEGLTDILLQVTFKEFVQLACEEESVDFLFGVYSDEDEQKAQDDAHELLRRRKQ